MHVANTAAYKLYNAATEQNIRLKISYVIMTNLNIFNIMELLQDKLEYGR